MPGKDSGPRGAGPRLLRRLGRALGSNLVIALALAFTLLVMGWASGYWILLRASYLLFALVPLAWLWARLNLRGLKVEVERRPSHLQAGQWVTVTVRVQNRTSFPKLWLEVEDRCEVPGAQAKGVMMLPAGGYRVWQTQVTLPRRGRYTFGPVLIRASDPFGLFQMERAFDKRWEVLVYPSPVPLPYFFVPAAQLPGEGPRSQPTANSTTNVVSVRDYQPGDPVSRIHWLSTARLGRLMAKTFDYSPISDVWILLDLEREVHAGEGAESTEEYMVNIACSIARLLLDNDLRVGMMGIGKKPLVLYPARGPVQYERIAEALALLETNGDVPLEKLLHSYDRAFGRYTTLVVITPSPRQEWAEALGEMGRRGVKAVVVLLEAETFGGREGPILPYSVLVALGITTCTVSRGQPISLALKTSPSLQLSIGGATVRR